MTTFDDYLTRWNLVQDGMPLITNSSQLLPVRYEDKPAMLKIAVEAEERWGNLLMIWWNGNGAARVFLHDDNAILMERAMGRKSLIEMSHVDRDDEASRIICSVTAKLHSRKENPPKLLPLKLWFKELEKAVLQHGGIFSQAHTVAKELLATPQDIVVLHGDIHHGNILDFGARGWLAIDPKHLIGERGFDYANLFCNPDALIATSPGRLARQVNIVADAARLEKTRLLKWILAYSALSAAWTLSSSGTPASALKVAKLSSSELKKC